MEEKISYLLAARKQRHLEQAGVEGVRSKTFPLRPCPHDLHSARPPL